MLKYKQNVVYLGEGDVKNIKLFVSFLIFVPMSFLLSWSEPASAISVQDHLGAQTGIFNAQVPFSEGRPGALFSTSSKYERPDDDDEEDDGRDLPPEEALESLNPEDYPNFVDDLNLDSLLIAINKQLKFFEENPPDPFDDFVLGPDTYESTWLVHSLKTLKTLIIKAQRSGTVDQLDKELHEKFQFYKSVGNPSNYGDVLFTGYYEVRKKASLVKTDVYKYPFLKLPPEDIAKVYSREQIEFECALCNRDLEFIWMDNIVDAYFVHVQGSAALDIGPDKMVRVNYAGQNGRKFKFISKYMVQEGMLQQSEVSMQSIKAYLSAHPEDIRRVLSYDESYVYFRQVDDGPVGSGQVVLVPGRSVATDYRIFSMKGNVALISTQKPIVQNHQIVGYETFTRLVLDQDTGGAITGPGRVDIFFGNDEYAELAAGHQKQSGDLYFLIEKQRRHRK